MRILLLAGLHVGVIRGQKFEWGGGSWPLGHPFRTRFFLLSCPGEVSFLVLCIVTMFVTIATVVVML